MVPYLLEVDPCLLGVEPYLLDLVVEPCLRDLVVPFLRDLVVGPCLRDLVVVPCLLGLEVVPCHLDPGVAPCHLGLEVAPCHLDLGVVPYLPMVVPYLLEDLEMEQNFVQIHHLLPDYLHQAAAELNPEKVVWEMALWLVSVAAVVVVVHQIVKMEGP